MRDFTFNTYKKLLESLQAKGYSFQTFTQYIISDKNSLLLNLNSSIILRHDVEAHYEQALKFAQIQNQLGIKGTYFFRLLPNSFKPEIVKQIADLGHEIGYHYDDLVQCKGDLEKAIKRFQKNLETLREIAPVQTICMDGSPLSKYDNKDLWSSGGTSASLSVREIRRRRDKETERQGDSNTENTSLSPQASESLISTKHSEGERRSPHQRYISNKEQVVSSHTSHSTLQAYYSYQDFGIIGEPYFDIDFNKVFYLTDTGRCWDGDKFNVRDKPIINKASSNQEKIMLERSDSSEHSGWDKPMAAESLSAAGEQRAGSQEAVSNSNFLKLHFHSTNDLIETIEKGDFPKQAMITFHPQRWNDHWYYWTKELIFQNLKNQVKRFLVK